MTASPRPPSTTRAVSGTIRPAIADAVDAYVWGYPLVVMHRTRALLCSRTPVGTLNHRDTLATARDRAVVAPNNDTLYSSAWFDLRAGDLTIDVPAMDHADRYWSVMMLDAYTNVAYVSRRTHGVDGATVRVTLDPTTEPVRGYADVVTMATPTVWALLRVLVDSPEDLAAAHNLQRSISITAPADHPTHLTEPLGRPDQAHTAGAAFFDELRAALAENPPAGWHPSLTDAARAVTSRDHHLDEDNLAAAVAAGEQRLAARGFGTDRLGNGWGTRSTGTDFGDDVELRAASAKLALAGHHPAENRSYVAQNDARDRALDGSRALALRFPPGEAPPCDGFWSLTVYQPDMFFHDNPLDRYAIGDRTPGLVPDDDGGTTIVIGGSRPGDDANWLPAPKGPYRLGLRVYEGHPTVVDATWFPPALEPV